MASTYEPIATISRPSDDYADFMDFASIPSTYTDLVLIIRGAESASAGLKIRLNSDAGSNYSYTYLTGNGSSASSGRASSQTWGALDYNGKMNTTLGGSVQIIQFMNYSNTSTYKTFISRANNASSGTDAIVNLWRSTAAISTIGLAFYGTSETFADGTTMTLYGIKAA